MTQAKADYHQGRYDDLRDAVEDVVGANDDQLDKRRDGPLVVIRNNVTINMGPTYRMGPTYCSRDEDT